MKNIVLHMLACTARSTALWVLAVSAMLACKGPASQDLAAPAQHSAAPTTPEAPPDARKTPAEGLATAPPGGQAADKIPSLTANGEPDTALEPGCMTWRWTTVDQTWKREPIEWNGATRTLTYEGTTQRFDAKGRVRDFGDNTARLEYDEAGNTTFRGEEKQATELVYRYRNTYDKQRRLVRVELSLQRLGAKPGPLTPYRTYHYDAHGLLHHMEIQVKLLGPLIPADLIYDTQDRLTQVEWAGSAGETELERFEYDAHGRLSKYERDGLVVPGGKARNGVLDWQQSWTYDDSGRTRRVEAIDGPDPQHNQRDITLFSPACSEIGHMAPDVFVYPYEPLPAANTPHWAG